jgi:hypothetical protein
MPLGLAVTPGDQLLEDIQQAGIHPEELTRAFVALLYGFLHLFNDADLDMIMGSVTRRLRRLQLVPEPMVTRMHGAMGAAAAGPSPLGWREQFGPMPPAEALALPIPPGCWPTCTTTSVRSAVSMSSSATGSLRCCSPWSQHRQRRLTPTRALLEQLVPTVVGLSWPTRGRLGPRSGAAGWSGHRG